jgi:hypothetical protein
MLAIVDLYTILACFHTIVSSEALPRILPTQGTRHHIIRELYTYPDKAKMKAGRYMQPMDDAFLYIRC